MRPYEGLLTAMVTPFAADGSVDEEAAVRVGRHLLEHGNDGLVICGTTGEAATLSDAEHLRMVELMVETLGDQGTMVAGTGSNETRHAVELTERAVELGVDAVLSVTPYYNKPNARGLKRHYEEVTRAAAGVPVILYNIPSRTGLNLPPEQLAALAQIDGIDAVKQANSDELQLIDGLAVLAGNDDILRRTLDIGGAGGICVSSHIVGDEMKAMFTESERRGEIDAALQDVYAAMFLTANPTPVKAALNLMGIEVGGLRLPMVQADADELAAVRAVLEAHGLLERAPAA